MTDDNTDLQDRPPRPPTGSGPPIGGVNQSPNDLEMGKIDPKIVPAELKVMPVTGVEEMVNHFIEQRTALQKQVADIEALLGFVATYDDLHMRVAAIELFVGIKR